MDVSRRRAGVKTSTVAAGSVWESRMKLDQVKGGIKVFNGEANAEEAADTAARKPVKKGPIGTSVSRNGKRKTWKSESLDGPIIQMAKGKKTESTSIRNNCEEQCREFQKTPIQARKGRSGGTKELTVSADGIDKSPIQVKKKRSELSLDGNEKAPVQIRKARSETKEVVESGVLLLRKSKSDAVDVEDQSSNDLAADNGIDRNSIQPTKSMSGDEKVLDESKCSKGESFSGIEKNPPEIEETGSEECCKEFGVCQEKVISNCESSKALLKSPPKLLVVENDDDDDEENDDVVMDEDEEIEGDEDLEEEVEIEVEKKSFEIKEIHIPEEKPKKVVEASIVEQKPKKIVNEEKKVQQFSNRIAPTSSIVNKQPPPLLRRATIYQSFSKPISAPVANRHKFPETNGKLQNLVDLVMWRDISRSAFVFGIGTFVIISSSYTKDLNVSFISVTSYLGLFYLAAIFLYRSLISRVVYNMDDEGTSYVLGEEEAVWLVKLVLPYLNEFLLKIRALFSGDPATTMKMAVLLFVLARCGNSITIWKMAKLGFFGVFTVPKVCSLYSSQLTAYGKFWIQRFRDAWDSCTHKKAVALAIFTLVWNLSSMVARIWAVFMMFVAVRYYQQTMERDDWVEEDGEADDDDEQCNELGQRQKVGSTVVMNNKAKKRY